MESPLDILSRAAGMVSSSNSPSAVTAVGPSDMRLMKRKFEDPLDSSSLVDTSRRDQDGGGCSSRILKKALIHHQAMLDTHHGQPTAPELDDQPLDMSCKKKKQSFPSDESLHRNHPAERTNSSSNSSSNSHNRPLQAPIVADRGGYYGNGVPHKKKWSSRSNGVDAPLNPPISSGNKLFLENNNSTSDGSGTDHARRPSVIYYATQTPDLPLTSTGSGSGGGSGGKFRRRFRHPSNSSTSTDSDAAAAPLIRRKLVKRKRKRPVSLTPGGVSLLPDRSIIDREGGESGCKSRRVVVITSKEDDIDEHFRRSLGDRYDEAKCFLNTNNTGSSSNKNGKPPASPSPPIVPAVMEKVQIIKEEKVQLKEIEQDKDNDDQPLSVDDHFAKALGTETWSRIISSKPPTTKLNLSPPPPYESKEKVVAVVVDGENGISKTAGSTTLTDGDGNKS